MFPQYFGRFVLSFLKHSGGEVVADYDVNKDGEVVVDHDGDDDDGGVVV